MSLSICMKCTVNSVLVQSLKKKVRQTWTYQVLFFDFTIQAHYHNIDGSYPESDSHPNGTDYQ